MLNFIVKVADAREKRENERLQATVEKQAALLDYVALMAGVDIPEEESEAEEYAED